MKLSARNVLAATVKKVTPGAVDSEVIVELAPGIEIVAIITKQSALRDHQGLERHDRGGLRQAHDAVVGNVNVKRAPPPGRCAAEMWPPCASTMALQMASPSPAPPTSASPRPRSNFANN
jgi:molybdopterin-binding protein